VESITAGSVTLKPEGSKVILTHDLPGTIEISWSSPILRPDQVSRYRYRLYQASADASREPFSEPMARTSVSYAGMDPGAYVFEVKAVGADASEGAVTRLAIVREQRWSEHPGLPVALSIAFMVLAGGMLVFRLFVAERRSRKLTDEVSVCKETGIQLETQRRFYGEAFAAAGCALLVFDESGRCVEVNREACVLFDVAREVLMTWTPADLEWRKAAESGQPVRWTRPDGTSFPIHIVSTSFVLDGRSHVLVSVSDLSSTRGDGP